MFLQTRGGRSAWPHYTKFSEGERSGDCPIRVGRDIINTLSAVVYLLSATVFFTAHTIDVKFCVRSFVI